MGTFLNVDRLRNNYEKVWVLFEDVEMEPQSTELRKGIAINN